MANDPTAERLRELFDYDPDTGVLARKDGGRAVLTTNTGGYRVARVDGRLMYQHRIAWAIQHGALPAELVDHINGNRSDNRLANLRLCDFRTNQQNRKRARRDSRTGVLGVQPLGGSYRASIVDRGKRILLGTFPTAEDAGRAYIAAKRRLHEHGML